MIYIFGSRDGNPLKVGFSTNPGSRLESIQSGHPFKLSVLRVWPHPSPERVERCAHARLRRFRMAGEWFLTDLETARAAVESAIVEVESPGGDASQPEEALWAAINRAGGARALARELGIAHQAISKWERVPPLRVLEVERISGISRYQLRPDIYGEKPR